MPEPIAFHCENRVAKTRRILVAPVRAARPDRRCRLKILQHTFPKRLGKLMGKPLSWLICARPFYTPVRLVDAYLNFLAGKGAGTGWDMAEEVRAAVRCIHRPRPTIFDLGANVGDWSQRLLQELPEATVYLFEPSPGCQAAIREKQLPRATLLPYAAGEQAGRALLHFSSETDGSASLHVRGDTPFRELTYQAREVEVVTIDQVIESKQIAFVDFMKMDIEGNELFALRGARQALAARKIGALSFEFGCTNVNSRTFFKDFWDLLTASGYSLARITPGGSPVAIGEYYEDLEYFRGATNYVAKLMQHPYSNSRSS